MGRCAGFRLLSTMRSTRTRNNRLTIRNSSAFRGDINILNELAKIPFPKNRAQRKMMQAR